MGILCQVANTSMIPFFAPFASWCTSTIEQLIECVLELGVATNRLEKTLEYAAIYQSAKATELATSVAESDRKLTPW